MKNFVLNCILYISKYILKFIYFFIKIFPTKKNKITMLSRQSNTISLDFQLIKEKVEEKDENISIVVLCKKIPKGLLKKLGYCFYMLKTLYHIATSSICIIDGYNIQISALKHKKELKIIQIWHSMGAIKKFGYQILNKNEGSNYNTAKIMQMHKNYTNVICTSNATKEFYSEAFGIEKDKILTLGMPRIDYLLGKDIEKKQEELYNQYPDLKEKCKIVYVPTFRKGTKIPYEEIIKEFSNNDKYKLIIRPHPLDKEAVDSKYLIDSKYETQDLIKIADYVITDYSAVAFEAAVLEKKLFFYLYDIKEYNENRGLNINLKEEMPQSTFSEIKDIKYAIENNDYEYENMKNFKEKYVETADTNNTERITDYVLGLIKNK